MAGYHHTWLPVANCIYICCRCCCIPTGAMRVKFLPNLSLTCTTTRYGSSATRKCLISPMSSGDLGSYTIKSSQKQPYGRTCSLRRMDDKAVEAATATAEGQRTPEPKSSSEISAANLKCFHCSRVGHIERDGPMRTCRDCGGCGQVAGNRTADGTTLASIVGEGAVAEESAISAQMMDKSSFVKSCQTLKLETSS